MLNPQLLQSYRENNDDCDERDEKRLNQKSSIHYDEEAILYHIERCWKLLGLYCRWLVTNGLLEDVRYVYHTVIEHPELKAYVELSRVCQDEADDRNRRGSLFHTGRAQHKSFVGWKQDIEDFARRKYGGQIIFT